MEMIGNDVEKKREQDARDYWSELRPKSLERLRRDRWGPSDTLERRYPKWELPVIKVTRTHARVVETINYIGEMKIEMGDSDMFNVMTLELRGLGEGGEGGGGWKDDDLFWDVTLDVFCPVVTKSFLNGSYYEKWSGIVMT